MFILTEIRRLTYTFLEGQTSHCTNGFLTTDNKQIVNKETVNVCFRV